MSDSDSDLDFESADEDLKGEDIDTSDLDIDDEEDSVNNKKVKEKESEQDKSKDDNKLAIESETKYEQVKESTPVETPRPVKEDIPVEEPKPFKQNTTVEDDTPVEKSKKTEEVELVSKSKPVEEVNPVIPDSVKEVKSEKSIEAINLVEKEPKWSEETKPQKEAAVSGWDDDADFSDFEDDLQPPIKDNKPKKELPIKQKAQEKGGWDNEDFSDIEDDSVETKHKNEPLKKIDPIKTEVNKVQEIKNLSFFNTDKPKKQDESSSWGSWSSFGSNFISTASNLTNQLNTGISTVLESVEATIGAPDPEELAKLSKEEEEKTETQKKKTTEGKNDWIEEDESQEWFSMGSNIVTGGLGVLETVGRKTFQAINDKDQNLKQTREFLKNVPTTMNQKPNLSELLREAQTTKSNKSQDQSEKAPTQVSFSQFFDEFTGSVHLEALEMLSRQSNVKLEVQPKPAKLKPTLLKFNEFFDSEKLNDDPEESDNDDVDSFFEKETFLSDFKMLVKNKSFDMDHFESLLKKYFKKCCFNLDLAKIISSVKETTDATNEIDSPSELLKGSMKYFALITSRLIEFYHKAAETILVEEKSSKRSKNSLDNTEGIYQITKLCLRSVTILADDFCKKCRVSSKNSDVKANLNQITADIYLEASNSSTYIADAYLLMEPIIKGHFLDQ